MAIGPPKLTLRKFPTSVTNLYHEGKGVPFALYHYTERLFNFPAYSKERKVARKLETDLKKYAELHANPKNKTPKTANYFLTHKEKFEPEDIDIFYDSLEKLLQKSPNIIYQFSEQQFNALIPAFDLYAQQQDNQLLLYQFGNQSLSGAPYIIGGHPHLDYFLWGNLFGIAKYTEQGGEENNYHVYFEHRQERTLEQALHDLLNRMEQHPTPSAAEFIEQPPQPTPRGAPNFGLEITPGKPETEE